ncbi:SDR family oxidoreductase [Undibacterium sp. Jales W-56]|uniref:SDR family oxidoreductase n=1 Tax=Undibacterium sp. Jales W-56 TaxID=2897325 RepID=UPI0021D24EB0|nr:SDR family oxidoreductase [Undibacterium sp. Jales W-56]MCU6433954.1 SDR family oxidoreductase [Undibacterium sp. Jales W-56]
MTESANNAASSEKPRVALVTGAARRIGRTIALALAQRGWDVAVHYGQSEEEALSLVAEIKALGRRSVALQCDLGNEHAVQALLPHVIAAFGGIQCIVNNASLFEEDQITSLSQRLLDQHMHVNLLAPLLLARALHAATPDGQQSCVINLLDQKLQNLNPDFLSYTLSKAALQCATTTLAQALAPKVRVVGVAPGITMISGHQTAADFAQAHQVTPLGRSSTPEDIAKTICFVADMPAITGSTIMVDGGQHLLPSTRDIMYVVTADTVLPNSLPPL